MTDQLRPRRRARPGDPGDPIEADAAKLPAFFARIGPPPWHALLPHFENRLWHEWQKYKVMRPNAAIPATWLGWLDGPEPPPDPPLPSGRG